MRTTIETREDLKLYLELFLTLFAISFFSIFAIRPTIATIIVLNQQIKSQQDTSKKLEEKINNLKTASKTRQQFEQDKVLINQAIPQGESPALAMRQIETLAAKDGISIVSSSVASSKEKTPDDPNKKGQNFSTTFLSASVIGTPEKTFSFLDNLGKLRWPVLWQTISLSGKPAGAASTIEVTLTGRMPFEKEEDKK